MILILAAILTAGGTVYFVQNWLSSERAAIEALRRQPKEQQAGVVKAHLKDIDRVEDNSKGVEHER